MDNLRVAPTQQSRFTPRYIEELIEKGEFDTVKKLTSKLLDHALASKKILDLENHTLLITVSWVQSDNNDS